MGRLVYRQPDYFWLKTSSGFSFAIGIFFLFSTSAGVTKPSQNAMAGGIGLICLSLFGLLLAYGTKLQIEITDNQLMLSTTDLFFKKQKILIEFNQIKLISQSSFTLSLAITLDGGRIFKIPSDIRKESGKILEEWPEGRNSIEGKFRDIFLLKYELQRRAGLPFGDF